MIVGRLSSIIFFNRGLKNRRLLKAAYLNYNYIYPLRSIGSYRNLRNILLGAVGIRELNSS